MLMEVWQGDGLLEPPLWREELRRLAQMDAANWRQSELTLQVSTV